MIWIFNPGLCCLVSERPPPPQGMLQLIHSLILSSIVEFLCAVSVQGEMTDCFYSSLRVFREVGEIMVV